MGYTVLRVTPFRARVHHRVRDRGAREAPSSVLLHDDGGEVDRQRVLQHPEPELAPRLLRFAKQGAARARNF